MYVQPFLQPQPHRTSFRINKTHFIVVHVIWTHMHYSMQVHENFLPLFSRSLESSIIKNNMNTRQVKKNKKKTEDDKEKQNVILISNSFLPDPGSRQRMIRKSGSFVKQCKLLLSQNFVPSSVRSFTSPSIYIHQILFYINICTSCWARTQHDSSLWHVTGCSYQDHFPDFSKTPRPRLCTQVFMYVGSSTSRE